MRLLPRSSSVVRLLTLLSNIQQYLSIVFKNTSVLKVLLMALSEGLLCMKLSLDENILFHFLRYVFILAFLLSYTCNKSYQG